jgi:hypothetical protein
MKGKRDSQARSERTTKPGSKGAKPWLAWVVVAGVIGTALLIGTLRLGDAAGDPGAASASASGSRLPSSDPPVNAAAIGLLGGLKQGDDVAGWKVLSITRSTDPQMKDAIAVTLEKDERSFIVWVALKGRLAFHAPIETKGFAIYYGAFQPGGPDAGGDADPVAQAAIDAIGARVRDNEDKTPAAGLL